MGTVPHPCVDIHTTPAPNRRFPRGLLKLSSSLAICVVMASSRRSIPRCASSGSGLAGMRSLDFLALLFGYAISGERTLQAFFDRLHPFADPFMALFERETLPHRSTLSRFLAALDTSCLEALRTVFSASSYGVGLDAGDDWWAVGPIGPAVSGLRYRRHARSRSPAQAPHWHRTSRNSPTPRCAVWTGLSGAPAWRGRTHPHDGVTDAYPAMAGQLWRSGQRRLSG